MSEAKHTAGPWLVKVDGTSTGRWPVIYTAGPYYDDGSSREVCDLETVEISDGPCQGGEWVRRDNADEIEANARLIAAAPELLEALQSVLKHCPADPDTTPSFLGAWHKAEAAIAKATGAAP